MFGGHRLSMKQGEKLSLSVRFRQSKLLCWPAFGVKDEAEFVDIRAEK